MTVAPSMAEATIVQSNGRQGRHLQVEATPTAGRLRRPGVVEHRRSRPNTLSEVLVQPEM